MNFQKQLDQLFQAVNAFMDCRAINHARHSDNAADELACQIEHLMTELGCYDATGELVANAAALLGKRGGSVRSKAKTAANRANGCKYKGQPRGGEAKRAAILSLHAQGKRGAEIAATVGVNRSYVSRVIRGKQ